MLPTPLRSRLIGRENDGTGMYFYRATYYSPTYQRSVSQDPIGFAGGDPSLYGYVRDNPVVLVDPSGLFTIGLGISLGFNFGGWVNINFSGGIVSDTYGNIGFYFSTAGGYGVGIECLRRFDRICLKCRDDL